MIDVRDVLDATDLAIGRADGILDEDVLETLGVDARRLRLRQGFVGEVLVVALAGGTGSGKSSILNAVVGDDVVATGVVRPTTDRPTAVHAATSAADLGPVLEDIGVDDRITREGMGTMALIDLPDFDSTETAHRHIVESVLPRVDAVVWVLDPEKYADPVLHDSFLASMSDHGDQFVFALNQADRLGADLPIAVETLEQLLREDGFTEPVVVPTVAVDPVDVVGLTETLAARWDTKATALAKMALDARRLARTGWAACGDVDLAGRGDLARDALALARATFVSLGVAAYEVHHRYAADR